MDRMEMDEQTALDQGVKPSSELKAQVEELESDFSLDDPEACPGCGCKPGDGITEGCEAEDGCGYFRSWGVA